MPDLIAFHLINSRVNKYKKDYALDNIGIAFDWVALEIILGLTPDEIEDALTDGFNDEGIDAIYTDNREVHIFSFKYATTFEKTNNNFPDTGLNTLLLTLERIFRHGSNGLDNVNVKQPTAPRLSER